MNVTEHKHFLTTAKTLFSPALVFALAATAVFAVSIIKPEDILPAEVAGMQGTEEAILYTPDVIKKADGMEPGRLAAAGKLDQATKKAYALAAAKPYDVVTNIGCGNVLSQSTSEDIAAEGFRLLKRSVALAPRSRYVRLNLAEKLSQKRRFDEAIAQYQLIIQGFPRWARPRLALSEIYMTIDRPAKAAEELEIAVELEPNNGQSKKMCGLALARAGKMGEGFEEYVMGCALEKIHQGLPPDLKQQLAMHGSLLKAESYFLQDLRTRPDDVTSKYMLGRIYLYTERYGDAKVRLMEARKRATSDPDVRRSLSIVLKKLGEDNLALNEFMSSVRAEQAQEKLKKDKL